MREYSSGVCYSLVLTLPLHRGGACGVRFAPNQLPGAVFACKFSEDSVRSEERRVGKEWIVGRTDVKSAQRVLDNVNPKHCDRLENGSRERARTSNPPVILYPSGL